MRVSYLAVVACAAAALVGVQPIEPVQQASAATVTCRDPGTRDPVLLVHGWNSTANTWQKAMSTDGVFGGSTPLAVSAFVYGGDAAEDKNLSLNWVTDAGIGHDLAEMITCLADKSLAAGGIGKVFLVAHSMGGLAIRCALDTKCNDAGRGSVSGAADAVAEIVTFGTPNQGSFLRVNSGTSDAENAFGNVIYAVCAGLAAGTRLPAAMPSCDYIHGLSNGSASVAFDPQSNELAALAPFNPPGRAQIPVREDGGRVSITTSLGTLWHHTLNGDVGDLVVGTSSATTQATAGDRMLQNCGSLDLSVSAGLIGGVVGAGLALRDLGAGLTCSHITETSDGAFLGDALSTINRWRDQHDPSRTALKRIAGARYASAPVAVPGGFEAATWGTHGNIEFWKWTRTKLSWTKISASTYPVLPRQFLAGPPESAVGRLMPGMSDAVFILSGQFSGDGTGNYIAFTNGPNGWGTVAPKGTDVLVPTGAHSTDNTTPGNEYAETFNGNYLETGSTSVLPYGTNGSEWMIVKDWSWTGGQFTLARSNIVTAKAAPPPPAPSSVPTLPLNTCPSSPPNGVYAAWSERAVTSFGHIGDTFAQQPKSVTISMQQNVPGEGPGVAACHFTVSPYFNVVIPVTSTSGTRWVTAPAWLLTEGTYPATDVWNDLPGSNLDDSLHLWSLAFSQSDRSPYAIPAGLHVVGFPPAGPGHVLATIHDGILTALTVLPASQ